MCNAYPAPLPLIGSKVRASEQKADLSEWKLVRISTYVACLIMYISDYVMLSKKVDFLMHVTSEKSFRGAL